MKKLTAFLLAMAMMLVAAPVFAAPQLSLTGEMNNKVGYDFNANKTISEMDVDLKLNVALNSGQNIRGMIVFSPITWDETLSMGNMTSDESTALVTQLRIREAYIESEGAFWKNGPSIITRIGDLSLNYSPYILESETGKSSYQNQVEGISIAGMRLGPLTADAFYGWAKNSIPVYGSKLATNLLGLQLETAFVRFDRNELDYMGKAVYSPNDKILLSGEYASNTDLTSEENSAKLARVGGSFVLPYGLNLSASYRTTDLHYSPELIRTGKNSPVKDEKGVTAWEASLNKKVTDNLDVTLSGALKSIDKLVAVNPENESEGYVPVNNKTREIGIDARAKQDFANFRAGYKLSYNADDGVANEDRFTHTTKLGIGVDEYNIANAVNFTVNYDVTLTNLEVRDMRHEVGFVATSDVDMLEGITVSGRYDNQPGENSNGKPLPKVEAKVSYDAPNGISLGYTYKTFAVESTPAVSEITAGIGVEF